MKKNSSTQLRAQRPAASSNAGSFAEPKAASPGIPGGGTATPSHAAPIAKAPPSTVFCYSQLCLEIKYNLAYYVRKCDLMRYLREQHDAWWSKYTGLYERDAYTFPTSRTSQGWDYTNAAKEMLSRCKLYDSLFTQVLKLDLAHVTDFGTYCKLVFLEINKLKPAFPDAPCSHLVFEHSVRDAMRFVLKQAPAGFPQDPAELGINFTRPAAGGASVDEEEE